MALYTVTAYGHDDQFSLPLYDGADYVEADRAYRDAVDMLDSDRLPSIPGRMLSRDQRVTVNVTVERGDTIASHTAYIAR